MTNRHLVAVGVAALVLGAAGLLSLSSSSRTAPAEVAAIAPTSAHAARASVSAAPAAAPAIAVDADSAAQFSVVVAGATNPRGRVDWERADVGTARSLVQSSEFDATGVARTSLPAGRYRAVVRVAGFATATTELAAPPKGTASARVELVQSVGVSGRVLNADGSSAHATVRVIPGERDWKVPDWTAESQTDDGGRFAFSELSVGEVRVVARAPGFGTAIARVHLPHAEPVELRLAASAAVRGFVTFADGAAAPGALVAFQNDAERISETTSPTGAFAVELPPGSWSVVAEHGDLRAELGRTLVAPAGSTHDLKLVLGPAALITGTVVKREGKAPVADARVTFESMWMSVLGTATTDEHGRFESPPLPAGRYFVNARVSGSPPSRPADVVLSAGQRVQVTVELRPAATLRGLVRDGAGAAVAGVRVRAWELLNFVGEAPAVTSTSPTGEFSLAGLERTTYVVRADAADGAMAVQRVSLTDTSEQAVTLVLGEPGTVDGRVSGLAPGATAFVKVGMLVGSGHFRWTEDERILSTEPGGAFHTRLPPGEWDFSVVRRARFGIEHAEHVLVETGKTAKVELKADSDEVDGKVRLLAGTLLDPAGLPTGSAALNAGYDGFAFLYVDLPPSGHFEVWGPKDAASGTLSLVASSGSLRAELRDVEAGREDVVMKLAIGRNLRLRVAGANERTVGSVEIGIAGEPAEYVSDGISLLGSAVEVRDVPFDAVVAYVSTEDGRVGSALVPAASDDATVEVTLAAPASLRLRYKSGTVDLIGPTPVLRPRYGPGERELLFTDLAPGEYELFDPILKVRLRKVAVRPGDELDLGELHEDDGKPAKGFVGLGLISEGESGVTVQPAPNSPALAAGMLDGDVVVAVDGAPVKTFSDCKRRIIGAPGTLVTIEALRGKERRSFVIRRAE